MKGALFLLLFTALSVSATSVAAPPDSIKGILIDERSSGEAFLRINGATGLLEGWRIVAEAHTKEDLLNPENRKSGYGIFTDDDRFLKFDPAGDRKALALIKESKKLDDFEVEVVGEVKGDTIRVISIKLRAED
jgi:hypothetical protein